MTAWLFWVTALVDTPLGARALWALQFLVGLIATDLGL
jgi:hypothetical protein